MRRPLILSLPAALLAACAGPGAHIEATGGDAFTLARAHLSGAAAVEEGLAEAQSFCGEHGRLFLMTNSEVRSGDYRLDFRCVAPNNVPPLATASAPPPPPPRATRSRRGAAPASGPPIDAQRRPVAAFQPAEANILAPVPAVTPRPLFAPPPGQSLVAAAPAARPAPPPDASPLVLLPRLESDAVAPPAAAAAAPAAAPELPPITREAPSTGWPARQAEPALPVITAGQPLPGYGLVVPSPNPLPGAPSSLPPIAGPALVPSFPAPPASGFPTGTTSFNQGFR